MRRVTFKFRAFTSLLTAFSFLISLISGIILYFTPQGRIALWTNWSIWGLSKDTWAALHINSSLIFFIMAFIHIYYNWKPLMYYMRLKAREIVSLKVELLVVLLISGFMVLASIYKWQPFSTIIIWNEEIKDYWSNKAESQPPIPHAEELTVTEFCEKVNVSLEKFTQKMQERGWKFDGPDQKLKDIAEQNGISPADIYKELQLKSAMEQGHDALEAAGIHGTGWGRKTVEQVCEELGIEIEVAQKRLADAGILVETGQNIKDIASKHNLKPLEVVNLIQN
ncbi:DUF4405 domain-containing protein [candidate division KSB1 bacterium]|nr:DUF4405 domain-containing protein [candidate division KSB1 bacterium]